MATQLPGSNIFVSRSMNVENPLFDKYTYRVAVMSDIDEDETIILHLMTNSITFANQLSRQYSGRLYENNQRVYGFSANLSKDEENGDETPETGKEGDEERGNERNGENEGNNNERQQGKAPKRASAGRPRLAAER